MHGVKESAVAAIARPAPKRRSGQTGDASLIPANEQGLCPERKRRDDNPPLGRPPQIPMGTGVPEPNGAHTNP